KAKRQTPYRRTAPTVHLRYGESLELRLLVPEEIPAEALALVAPLRDRPITDLKDLLWRIRRLDALGCEVTVYPDAETYIENALLLERLAATAAAVRADPAGHPLRTELLKAELLPYQLDGIAFAAGAGRAILADDMGLGKTIQGIGTAELLAREAGITRVLVVCPTSLKSQWRSEVERFAVRECRLVLGGAEERARQYEDPPFFTICNYEQVLRDIHAIEPVRWDLIILDEGQRIKNWEAKTSRIIKGLRSPFALVLSGTPLENRLDELFSVVEFIDDRRLGPAFRFYNRYRVADERGRVLGYKNLDELRERLKPVLLRRTRAQVARELPRRSTEIRRIAPTREQLDLHDGYKQVISTVVKKRHLTELDLLRLQKALLLCRMAANSTFLVDKTAPGYSSKLAEIEVLLEQLLAEDERKILVFSEWTTMLNLIEPILDERGASYVRLDGSVPQKKRQQLVHRFQNDPSVKLFLTTNAGATGLNLQAADTIVNVDLPWNPALLEQRIARAHRMGQKRPVQVYLMVTEATIEESLLATLSAKHELALAALDPDSEVSRVELRSGIEELKRRLEVLIGERPAAPVDESEKARVEQELQRLQRKQKIATAGGQLLGAAFTFMGEVLAKGEETEQTRRMAETFRERLAECLERDDEGNWRMTVTFPDPSVLDSLAHSLARLAGTR
ncbi:MAG: DEAD/DEAH box helicase, partial [Deltaproteobacteria bacterium]|nr:DEAD/DEAH box helicase [Deltaproteobacteria bacterium]